MLANCEGFGWDNLRQKEKSGLKKTGKGNGQVNYRALNLIFSEAVS
jgi:hypothetical protein